MGRPLAFAFALVLSSAVAGGAEADKLTEKPQLGPRLRLSKRVRRNLNDYSIRIGSELNNLTMGLMKLRVDFMQKNARFHLGGGDPEAFRLRIDSHVLVKRGVARVKAQLDVVVAGHRLAVQMPDVDLRTKSVAGHRDYQLSLPLIEGRF